MKGGGQEKIMFPEEKIQIPVNQLDMERIDGLAVPGWSCIKLMINFSLFQGENMFADSLGVAGTTGGGQILLFLVEIFSPQV